MKAKPIHSLKKRERGKWNARITLCNKPLGWQRKTSNNPEKITCKCCKKRRIEIIEASKHQTEEALNDIADQIE